LFVIFVFRFQAFIQQNEDEPVAGPPEQNLDDAVVVASDEEDDFFAAADLLSQQAEDVQPRQGLLGLDGPVTPLKIELENYLTLPKPPNSKVNVLLWWKDHQYQLPLLAQAARKYLCVTASSAPSERLFSASGNVVTNKRSSLDPINVDKIVYLHENMGKVNIKYDFSLLPTKDAAEDPEEVVQD
jgi:hypothetical protein